MCAQALDSKITTIAPWRDAEFLEKFKVPASLQLFLLILVSGWPWRRWKAIYVTSLLKNDSASVCIGYVLSCSLDVEHEIGGLSLQLTVVVSYIV